MCPKIFFHGGHNCIPIHPPLSGRRRPPSICQTFDVDQMQRTDVVAGAVARHRAASQRHRRKHVRLHPGRPLRRGRIRDHAIRRHAQRVFANPRVVFRINAARVTQAAEPQHRFACIQRGSEISTKYSDKTGDNFSAESGCSRPMPPISAARIEASAGASNPAILAIFCGDCPTQSGLMPKFFAISLRSSAAVCAASHRNTLHRAAQKESSRATCARPPASAPTNTACRNRRICRQ